MIEFHNPEAETAIENTDYALKLKVTGSNHTTLGLLANGFPDSERFLEHIANLIQVREPGVTFKYFNKGNASIPASPEILDEIVETCQGVITAYGH